MSTQVRTKYDVVEGFEEGGVAKWLGVPFVKPPIGELRFRRAQSCIKIGRFWPSPKLRE